jgi:antirestriction protein ArdC
MAKITSLSLAHVDTCLPYYLTDHHNRNGEILLAVPVDGTSTLANVLDELKSQFHGSADFPEDLLAVENVDALFNFVIEDFRNGEDPAHFFDSNLDCPPSDDIWSDEYDDAIDYSEQWFRDLPSDDARHEAEAEARSMAQEEKQRWWKYADPVYAYFVVSYEIEETEETK